MYKVGDRVKLLTRCDCDFCQVGWATVTRVSRKSVYVKNGPVKWKGEDDTEQVMLISLDQVEPFPFMDTEGMLEVFEF